MRPYLLLSPYLVVKGDRLRRQAQQPHTAAHDLSNFHEALVGSQKKLYDPPGDLFDTKPHTAATKLDIGRSSQVGRAGRP